MSGCVYVPSPSLKIIAALFDERFLVSVFSYELRSLISFGRVCVLCNSSPISNDDDDDIVDSHWFLFFFFHFTSKLHGTVRVEEHFFFRYLFRKPQRTH